MTDARRSTEIRGHGELADALIALGVWACSSTTMVVGTHSAWGTMAVLALPLLGFACLGHLPGRGAVVGLIVAVIALATVSGGSAADRGMAVLLVGMLEVVAIRGGRAVGRTVPA